MSAVQLRRFALLPLLLAGCASRQREPIAERVTVTSGFDGERLDLTYSRDVHAIEYAVPADRVFRALLAAHEELKIPLQTADSRAGTASFLLQTQRLLIADRRASAYFDCGNSPAGALRADSYRLSLRVSALVDAPHPERARLRLLVAATARDAGQSGLELRCTTTGQLEKTIATAVARQLVF